MIPGVCSNRVVCSIRVFDHKFVYKSMGFTYPDKFTYPNTSVIQMAQMYSDNGGPTLYTMQVMIFNVFYHICISTCTKQLISNF